MNLNDLTKQVMDPLVGSEFTIKFNDGNAVTLTLVEVVRVMERVQSSRLKREPFSAYFEAPDTFMLPQATYPFTHAAFGEEPLPIFIVPVARENGKFRYEAVFT